MSSLIKNLLTLGTLLVLAALGYYLFVIERDSTLNSGTVMAVGEAERDTQEFLRRLSDLQKIKLNTGVFQDVKFRSLNDFSSIIERVQAGRANPFEEVGE